MSKKSIMLNMLEQALLSAPLGMSRSEIAKQLGIHRSTAGRYIDDLSAILPVWEDDDKKVHINRNDYLHNLQLTIHELLAVHLGARLLENATDKYNPHITSTLKKLADTLKPLSLSISGYINQTVAAMEARKKPEVSFIDILQTLTIGWADRQRVRVTHYSNRRKENTVYEAAVYYIEAYPPGKTLHAICKCKGENHLRTFRIDRISGAKLLKETCIIPEEFNIEEKLRYAWGIWYTEGPPVRVKIKFSPEAAQRVRETKWHNTETTEELPEGFLVWQADIAEPIEMLPWIRGWGASAEVLEPKDLRERLREECGKMAKIYRNG
ncbi:MAG: WYL domain-containing transcriptional regulator [Spirochaetales bacterium]|nr:WYL domain-containing transcriptional regulator [Spirochaetales bacterium]